MERFIYGVTKRDTVLNELARNGYKLHEYDDRLCYNCYTYVVNWTEKHLTLRTYFFDENNILIGIETK